DVDAGVQLIALVAAEKERPIFHDGPANRSAELVLLKERLRQLALNRPVRVPYVIEVVARIESVAPQLLECPTVPCIGAGFRDDPGLAAATCAELGGVGARFHTEFLDVLEARLQLERRRDLAVQVARRRVDDGRALDAVVANRVLFHCAPAEA